MENPIKMDDLGVPLFLETTLSETHVSSFYPKKNIDYHS